MTSFHPDLFVGLLPASRLKNHLLRKLGHAVSPDASVQPILLLGHAHLDMGARSRVGAFTCIRGASVTLETGAEIGQLNWISAASFLTATSTSSRRGSLVLGNEASLTNRHYLDASGGITIGPYATVAGVRSTFMTHGIDTSINRLVTKSISVGEYAMVGSNATFVPGAEVPPYSVVAMGSIVAGHLPVDHSLYTGVATQLRRPVPPGEYHIRTSGAVPPRELDQNAGQSLSRDS